ncbi:MAG: stage V sporulation protein AD [Clostridia bacterium]|nr:stage V sporulation protein AD [Clostridia bacterium]
MCLSILYHKRLKIKAPTFLGGLKLGTRIGKSTLIYTGKPRIRSYASIVGPKEGRGPLADTFDMVMEKDDLMGESSFEKAERKMYKEAVKFAIEKGGLVSDNIDFLIGGDLLNQIISASFAARDLGLPYIGLYNACSTMAESLLIGSALIDGGFANTCACAVSSHFSTAERQYRMPLELGNQRTPTAQWTVTGCGCTVLQNGAAGPAVTCGTVGRVIDYDILDANNMGAAMAPAAADLLITHFRDTGKKPSDYDLIATGDLGMIGMKLRKELMQKESITLGSNYIDCGCEIFSADQDVHAGGSGCGCSASVLNGHLLSMLEKKEINSLLFAATGALLSTTSSMQGDSIPCIAHCVVIENVR